MICDLGWAPVVCDQSESGIVVNLSNTMTYYYSPRLQLTSPLRWGRSSFQLGSETWKLSQLISIYPHVSDIT